MNRVCLFIRVSTDKQDYQRQILELNEFCKQKHFDVTETIASKITGTKIFAEREDLQRLFDLAANGKPLDHFEKSDKVIWQIDLVTGGDSPKWNQVYDSSRDTGNILDNLIKEAISEAGEVKIDNES